MTTRTNNYRKKEGFKLITFCIKHVYNDITFINILKAKVDIIYNYIL